MNIQIYKGFAEVAVPFKHAVLTIGNFDGVHLGHQKIIHSCIARARCQGGTAIAYTFRPHPRTVLQPESSLSLLTTYDERLALLAAAGVDVIVEEPFGRDFSTFSAEKFFKDVVLNRLGAREVVVGHDFGFGRERSGHLGELRQMCARAGIQLEVAEPVALDGELISSSKIRQRLLSGAVEKAASLLGREFSYRGVVVRGDGRGKGLGFPTANLKLGEDDGKLVAGFGVYACKVGLLDSLGREAEWLPAVINLGVRPTFADPGTTPPVWLECFILSELPPGRETLYGETIEVRLIHWIREERRFESVDALKTQIAADVARAREILD